MVSKVLILSCVFLTVVTGKLLAPRDLVDEVLDQLQQLNSIVQGKILTAHDGLDNMITDFTTYSKNVELDRGISLQQEQQRIEAQLSSIKSLASAVNADITVCTNIREDVLNRLPSQYSGQLTVCINQVDSNATRLTGDARYVVDVVINRVNQLEYQVRQCNREILCLSPLVNEIELDKIRLPQNIDTEVQATEGLVTTLKNSVNDCGTEKVYQYVTTAYTIVADITRCVNRILG